MGQDIHMAVERWQNGQWTLQPDIPVWDNRDYLMFSVLTGRHSGEIPNISHSRGVPTDIDKHTFVEDSYGNTNGTIEFLAADHSYSWLLLSEIKSFNWNSSWSRAAVIPLRQVDKSKAVEVESYDIWRLSEPHEPKGYYSDSSSSYRNSNIPHIGQADKYLNDWDVELIKKDGWDLSLPFYVWVGWTVYMKNVSKDFLYWIDTFVSPIDEANAVRIIFGFDS